MSDGTTDDGSLCFSTSNVYELWSTSARVWFRKSWTVSSSKIISSEPLRFWLYRSYDIISAGESDCVG